jgi:hypothetical protein
LELLLAVALALSFVMETLKSALNLMMLFNFFGKGCTIERNNSVGEAESKEPKKKA